LAFGLPLDRQIIPIKQDRGIFERVKGSKVFWIRYADSTGKIRREKVGRKSLALKVYQKRKTEVREGRFFSLNRPARGPTIEAVIDDYLGRIRGKLRSYRDYRRNGTTWKNVLRGRTLRQIVPGDIERYVTGRLAEVKVASINRELSFIKRVFNVAIADGLVEVNPVCRVKMFKENNQRTRFLSDDEESRLLAALPSAARPLVTVAIHTGLRQGEQFQLRWTDVDFTTRIITIPRSKHGESRTVPMNSVVRTILEELRQRKSACPSPFYFPSRASSPIEPSNFLHRVFKPALSKAGISNFTWHSLRHTFASRLVMKGVDLRTV
jgi:site-specific recombinase XerD